jgi:NAD-dependent dihydropyrimidine dehydrogenase PreA subunit
MQMQREIIHIDEDLCDGCGDCVPSCAEGAIQIIDGKARLVKDALCDGLGACLGDCPQGALTVETRGADDFDQEQVHAHLSVLKQEESGNGGGRPMAPPISAPAQPAPVAAAGLHAAAGHGHGGAAIGHDHGMGGCPGSRMQAFEEPGATPAADDSTGTRPSELRQWPVQMHLLSPMAPYFQGADVLLCADCVPFAVADFHRDHLKGNSIAIACPKLDVDQEIYLQKLISLIDDAKINMLKVMIMQVPCCGGMFQMAKEAVARASRKVPVKVTVVGLRGEILSEEWA